MIRHHPDDELMLALAAGRLRPGRALLVAVHLEACADCRSRLHTLQALGGALIDDAEPQTLAPDAWARTLERIDTPAPRPAVPMRALPSAAARPDLPAGLGMPASLRGCAVSGWRWIGPGMRFSRVTVPHDREASIFLLRIAPGRSLPRHSHGADELTQVLCGTFDDGRALFGAGDFDAADGSVWHQPVVQPGSECVCLAYVGAPLKFEGRIAALIGGWIGM